MKKGYFLQILVISLLCFSFTTAQAQRHRHHNERRNTPQRRYEKMPHWGHHYRMAPRGAYVFPYKGINYQYYSGVFYKPIGNKYAVVRPPLGIRVRTLPQGYVRFRSNGRMFFYYYGTYYVKSIDDSEYITVAPPVGAIVDALPDGYRKVTIDGLTYYEFEGSYYKAVLDDSGEVLYEVVGVY